MEVCHGLSRRCHHAVGESRQRMLHLKNRRSAILVSEFCIAPPRPSRSSRERRRLETLGFTRKGVRDKCFSVVPPSSTPLFLWKNRNQIEETNAAGRHAVVCAVRRKALDSRVSESTAEDTQPQQHGGGVASPEDSTRHDSTSEGSDLEDESEQGRDEIQALLERVVAPVRDRRSSRAMYNDFNGGERALPGRRASTGDADGRGTEGVRPGGFLARNVAAARLPSTGVERKPVHATGTSRGPTRGSRGVTSASRRGRRCSSRDGGDDGRGRSTQRPLRLSRPLFIEIENKASERPLRAAIVGARGKGKAQRRPKTPARKRSAVAEQEEREESDVDSDGELLFCLMGGSSIKVSRREYIFTVNNTTQIETGCEEKDCGIDPRFHV